MADTTHFGFRKVATEQKQAMVRDVFDNVASRYDIMNDFMSAGLHRVWKNDMVAWLAPRSGMRILDVAGGTGDIAFRMRKKADCSVTVCDINEHMVVEGRDRAIDHNNMEGIDWMCGNAQSLPFADNTWDAYTIAFGIRNVTHIDQALAEAYRVLKPGGRFMCLEFSEVQPEWMRKLYDTYSFNVIPQVGKLVTGNGEPYQYLVESIRQFPNQEAFAAMIRTAGFGNVQYRSLTHGVVAIHSGRKF